MAANKESFILYRNIIHMVKKLPDEKAGQLFKLVLSYVNDELGGDPVLDDLILEIAFEPIKQSLKFDLKKYEAVCERNKKNGLNGGRPTSKAKGKNPKKPSGINDNPNEPKKADIDMDMDMDMDIKKKSIVDIPPISDKQKFENFRKLFPGTKNGLDVEFKNFSTKGERSDLDLLIPALEKEIDYKSKCKDLNIFCPEWKNLKTWINNKCWCQEFPVLPNKPIQKNVSDEDFKKSHTIEVKHA